jgi:hypothetical protein
MPASVSQIEANRRNAAGPHHMTDAGKQAIRANAVRHGLTTKLHVVLPGEDRQFYNQILESLQNDYSPANTQEDMLVQQIAEHYWRLIRVRNMETGSLEGALKSVAEKFGVNPAETDDLVRGSNLAITMSKSEGIFSKLHRYEAAIERSYYRAIRELQKLQKTPKQNRECERAVSPAPEIRSVPQNPAAGAEIRSVPQKEPSPVLPSREQDRIATPGNAEFRSVR